MVHDWPRRDWICWVDLAYCGFRVSPFVFVSDDVTNPAAYLSSLAFARGGLSNLFFRSIPISGYADLIV